MKRFLLLLLLLTTYGHINAQRYKEIIKWEVPTKSGGLLFGISHNKGEAKYIIEDFKRRNKKTKYDITNYQPVYMFSTIKVKNYSDDPVKIFKNITNNKGYKVFGKEDLDALNLLNRSNLITAANQYANTKKVSLDYAINRITQIKNLYTDYRILSKYYNSISRL